MTGTGTFQSSESRLAWALAATMFAASASGQILNESAKLLPSDGAAEDWFGWSVSVSGDVVVVGARFDDDNGSASGSAYVFRWNGMAWAQDQKLLPDDGAAGDEFGESVSVSGDVAVVGALGDDDNGTSSGSAYVFRWNGTTWAQEQKLLASDGAAGDNFGFSVSVSGGVAVVGARFDNDNGTSSGSAYVFRWKGTTWAQEQKLLPADAAGGDEFGWSVSVSGEVAVVGALGDDDNGSSSGSAYVFRWNGTTWAQERKLLPDDGAEYGLFGFSVSVSGGVAVVGAHGNDDNGSFSGSAYVFRWNGTTWAQEQKLLPDDGAWGDNFGISVSVSGDVAMVGAFRDNDNGSLSGSAYVFRWNGTTWAQEQKLLANDGAAGDNFGRSVSVASGVAVVGAWLDDDNGLDSGSAYVFSIDCNGNGIDDVEEIASCPPDDPACGDCNADGRPDECDLADCPAGDRACADCDADSVPDGCESDTDADGVIDDCDPCPLDDPDDPDADGVCTSDDQCPATPLGLLVDQDGCTRAEGPCCFAEGVCIDHADLGTCAVFGGEHHGGGLTCNGDPDGDGARGCVDGCPLDGTKFTPGICGCGVPDDDGDLDGVADCLDLCPDSEPPANACGCRQVGACCSGSGECLGDVERGVCLVIDAVYQGDGSVCDEGCNFGDVEVDGRTDLLDFAMLQRCFGTDLAVCAALDADRCGTIDLSDYLVFQQALTGP